MSDLPTWVLDLVYRLDRAEDEHPTLYRYKGRSPFPMFEEYEELDTCYLAPLLAMVPEDVLNGVRFAARWQPTPDPEPEPEPRQPRQPRWKCLDNDCRTQVAEAGDWCKEHAL